MIPIQSSAHAIRLLLFIIIPLVVAGAVLLFVQRYTGKSMPATFEECAATRGSVIQESNPAVCVTKNGVRFVQLTDSQEQAGLISSTPNLDTMSNWKTYRNEEYGFEFNYPPELDNPQETGKSFNAYFQSKPGYPFSMIVNIILHEKSLDRYLEELEVERSGKKNSPAERQPLVIAGRNAFQDKIIDRPQIDMKTFIDLKQGVIVQIYVIGHTNSTVESIRNLNNSILSTFRLLEEQLSETGSDTYCTTDRDCWCEEFTGARFVPGGKVGWRCNEEINRCESCFYY